MQHSFLYKNKQVNRHTDFEGSHSSYLGLLIDYTDVAVTELDFWSYQNPENSLSVYIYDVIGKKPEIEHFVYSDEFTEKFCRDLLATFSKPRANIYHPLALTNDRIAESLEKVLKVVKFFPFADCPELAYQKRIETLFEEQASSIQPFKNVRYPFAGTRRLYDDEIIGWLK